MRVDGKLSPNEVNTWVKAPFGGGERSGAGDSFVTKPLFEVLQN